MFVDLLTIIKEISARPDYERGTPVYFDTRLEGPRTLPDVAETLVYDCANGMELVIDLDREGLVLGIEVFSGVR